MRLAFRRQAPPTFKERILERVPVERLVARIPVEQIKDRIPIMMKPEPPSRLRRAAPLIGAGVAGAAVAFVFDPARGRERRAKAREMIASRVHRSSPEGDNSFQMRDYDGPRMPQASAR